jgi:hypothetical protein
MKQFFFPKAAWDMRLEFDSPDPAPAGVTGPTETGIEWYGIVGIEFDANPIVISDPPPPFDYALYNQAGSTTVTAWPTLRVSVNAGAYVDLATASLTFAGLADDVISLTGLSGTVTSMQVTNKQEQGSTLEPFWDANSIDDLYLRHNVEGAPQNTTLPGLPICANPFGIPVEVEI